MTRTFLNISFCLVYFMRKQDKHTQKEPESKEGPEIVCRSMQHE